MSAANVTPIRQVPESSPLTFEAIETDFHHWFCLLSCAVTALGTSLEADRCEIASRAEAALCQCVENFDRIRADLDAWNVTHKHTLKAPVRP